MGKEQDLTLQKNRNSLDTMQLKLHNQMARTLARFDEPEHAKLFLISLGTLLKSSDNIARISKIELFDKLNVPAEDKNKHKRYFDMFNSMRKRTEFDITIDEDTQIAGNIISLVKRTRNEYLIKFEEEITPTLKELKGQYTLLYIDSIMQFKSSYSITLYNYLLSWHNKKYTINKQWLSTKQLKELFGLSEEDYVKKSGKFDRNNFEKRTIQKAVDEITEAGYMHICWYKAKDKLTKKVIAYVFEFVVLDHDKEKENGLIFTDKQGKVDDVIISDENELDIEPKWNDNIEEKEASCNTSIEMSTLKQVTNNEFDESELQVLDNLIMFYSNDYNKRTDYLKEKYLLMNSKKPKNRFNYLMKIIKNDTLSVIEGQTTIEDFLEEDTHVAEFDKKELDELLGDLKEGRL